MRQSDLSNTLDRLRQELRVGNSKDLVEAIGYAVLAIGERLESSGDAVPTEDEVQRPVGDPEAGGV